MRLLGLVMEAVRGDERPSPPDHLLHVVAGHVEEHDGDFTFVLEEQVHHAILGVYTPRFAYLQDVLACKVRVIASAQRGAVDAVPACGGYEVIPVILLLSQFGLDPLPGARISEPLQCLGNTAFESPGREQRGRGGGPCSVRVDVAGDVEASGPCFLDEFHGPCYATPVGTSRRFEVADLERNTGPLGDPDDLFYGGDQTVPLAPDVGREQSTVVREHRTQLGELLSRCVAARCVHQTEGQPFRPDLKRLLEHALHSVQLCTRGWSVFEAHHSYLQGSVPDIGGHVT